MEARRYGGKKRRSDEGTKARRHGETEWGSGGGHFGWIGRGARVVAGARVRHRGW